MCDVPKLHTSLGSRFSKPESNRVCESRNSLTCNGTNRSVSKEYVGFHVIGKQVSSVLIYVTEGLSSSIAFRFFHTMFARVSRTRATRTAVSLCRPKCRSYVQPSVADRASVVEVPSTYQEDNLFTPRPGAYSSNLRLLYTF
jgi:hypothetical protein